MGKLLHLVLLMLVVVSGTALHAMPCCNGAASLMHPMHTASTATQMGSTSSMHMEPETECEGCEQAAIFTLPVFACANPDCTPALSGIAGRALIVQPVVIALPPSADSSALSSPPAATSGFRPPSHLYLPPGLLLHTIPLRV